MNRDWIQEYAPFVEGRRDFFHNGFRLFVSNAKTTFPVGVHSHDEYEFMYSKNNDIQTFCNGKKLPIKKGCYFPFNSFDNHGQDEPATVNGFVCLLFSSSFIAQIAREVFDFKNKPLFFNKSFLPSSNLNFYLGAFINEYCSKIRNNRHSLDSLQKLIAIELFRSSFNNVVPNQDTNAPILRAKLFLQETCHQAFDLQQAAQVAGMNKYYFVKRFVEETGFSPQQYSAQLKIEHAKAMIAIGEKKLIDIAYELGYSTQAHFCSQFKKHTGITAREYKKTLI